MLLRWSEMVEKCREVGITTYAVRAAIQAGEIAQITPRITLGAKQPRAYYSRENIENFCKKIVDTTSENGLLPDDGVKPGRTHFTR